MDNFSISNSVSKNSVYESESMVRAYQENAAGRFIGDLQPEMFSNEIIRKGDTILQTYTVAEDAVHGGMGSVWKVHHLGWDTNLAMKRPQPRFFAEGSERRKRDFIAECEHWINLGLHPNIVSCYYVREIGGVPTIFSEWMDGGSLKDAIRDGRLYDGTAEETNARILDIAIQAARGLEYSHEQGLVHQDMKPGNLLLTKEWEARVADFGLAQTRSRMTDGAAPLSSGYTPEYCPEEQAEGAPAEPWMDLYAWALTVLEMYVGTRLWKTGAEAKENIEECFSGCRVPVPGAVRDILADCISGTEKGFHSVGLRLTEAYRSVTGHPYPRPVPEAAPDAADSLNNRALSFLDLGKHETAEACWQQALAKNAEAENSIYNYALYQWRYGKSGMADVLDALGKITDREERDAMQKALFNETKAKLVLRSEREAKALCSGPEPISGRHGRRVLDGTELLDAGTGQPVAHCSFSVEEGMEAVPVYRAFLNEDSYVLVVFHVKRKWADDFYLCWIWNAVTGQALFRYELQENEYRVEDGAFFLLASPEEMRVEEAPRAPYRLNAVRSTAARLKEQEEYDRFIREAGEALRSGNAGKALELADLAAGVPGFEAEPEPVRLRAAAGRGFCRSAVRRILQLPPSAAQAAEEEVPVLNPEDCSDELLAISQYVQNSVSGKTPETTEYSVRAMPAGLSRDGRFLLADLEMEKRRENPDLQHCGLDGFAVVERKTGRIVLCEKKLFSERYGPRDEKTRRILHLSPDGAYVLAAENRILRVIRVRDAKLMTVLYAGPYLYADFLQDVPYVLSAGTDADNRGEERFLDIIDLEDGAVAYEGIYPDHLAGSLRPVSPDRFDIRLKDGKVSACLIDWDYSEKKKKKQCRIEINGAGGLLLINRRCRSSDLEICRQVLRTAGWHRHVFRGDRNELYTLFVKLHWEWTLEPWGISLLKQNTDYEVRFIPAGP